MAVNSRRKGKVGELEAAQVLRQLFGWRVGRSQQHSGTADSADLRSSSVPGLWIEVKRQERLSLPKTMAVAASQCGRRTPVVLHRTNRSQWLLTIRLADLPQLCHAYHVAQDESLAASEFPDEKAGSRSTGAKD